VCVQVPASFDYVVAASIDDAIGKLAHDDDARIIAGGHSLLPMMKLRLASPATLIDISRLEGDLRYVREDGPGLRIGALATHRDLLESPVVAQRGRVLADAERVIADPLVRNMGTVGGSVAHADSAEDLAAALLTLDAMVGIRGPNGAREVALDEFYLGPYTTVLEPGEMVVEIHLPRGAARGAYLKVERRAGDWAAAALGISFDLDSAALKNVRIGLCAVGATSLRAKNAEAILEGKTPDPALLKQAAEAAAAECEPVADGRGSEAYKRNLVRVLVPRAAQRALAASSVNGSTYHAN
jgi:carbon-monoxide dehydrogenase medium subunit